MALPSYANREPTFAELYERELVGPLFRPWVSLLLDRARLPAGARALDVACGTGIVARTLRERLGPSARVQGLDASAEMLAVARAQDPSIDWREGNAEHLPFTDGSFTNVFCQQGLQFFTDRAAAAREMRRVLAPDGRAVVATWRPVQEIPCFAALAAVAERTLGPVDDRRHGFGDGAALERLLRDAGFRNVEVEVAELTLEFANASAFARLNAGALVGMSAAGATMTAERRAAAVDEIVAASRDALAPFAQGAGVAFACSTNLATALA